MVKSDKSIEIINKKFRKLGLNPDEQNRLYDKTQRFYNPLYDSSNNKNKIIIK